MDLGGREGRYFTFGPQGTQPGTRIAGKVLGLSEVQSTEYKTGKPETWDNGDPKMQYRITLQTDLRDPANPTDTGVRDVYLDGARKVRDNGTQSKLCAVLEAVRAVTGGTALSVGGFLELVWVSGMGFEGDPRNFQARYQAPSIELGQPAQQHVPPMPQNGPPPVQQPVAVPQGFAQQQVQAYTGQTAPAATPLQQAVQQQIPVAQPGQVGPTTPNDPFGTGVPISVPTEQGPVNPQTGETTAITAEKVAAIKAAGMDPAQVWPGVDLSAFGV
jgi:hypothetical protein